MNILYLASHAVAEYDLLDLFTRIGYDTFVPGGYERPSEPGEGMRPSLPDAPYHPDLVEACNLQREAMGDPGHRIDWAKAVIHPAVLDWADTIICEHFPERWLVPQWGRIRDKRVIWRTCGQSSPGLERMMFTLRRDGLQIVRYSPAERRAFTRLGQFAGEDAVIRFWKDPDEWNGWVGEPAYVTNVTQNLMQRGEATNGQFWLAATKGLPTYPIGEGSEVIGGPGKVSYEDMKDTLRNSRAYLYTGTQPASYTLGLIEAMMTGIPVVSIGPAWMQIPDLFEAPDLVHSYDQASDAQTMLRRLLADHQFASDVGSLHRDVAVALFGRETIARQWIDFLGNPMTATSETVEMVTA
jgi:hypothetical protein